MQGFFIYNGKFYNDDETVIGPDNRSFRYGDGLFETMRLSNGRIPLAAYHFERLFAGLQLLRFDIPKHFTTSFLAEQIQKLCIKNKAEKAARVRLNVFRGNGGLFDPDNLRPNYIIQCMPLDEDKLQWNENGLLVDVFADGRKTCDRFSSLKSNNYLLYAMAALHAKKNQLNDCLVLNIRDRVADSTIANVFLVKENHIYTPPLSEGCVAGVMRRYLIEKLQVSGEAGYKFEERQVTVRELEKADEVFLTNAFYGIKWVKEFAGKRYGNTVSRLLYNEIVKKLF
ncbi:MAG: aminotransferase class IV [Chitinophagaceae bacterium]|nr:aminotransferase class IV [Chitinophagaceae bacterium]